MNIQIISDIHGNAQSLIQALTTPIPRDLIILVGDYLNHGPLNPILDEYNPELVAKTLNEINVPIIAVRGNCDSEVDQMLLDFPMMNDDSYFRFKDKTIYITHGHLFEPKTDMIDKKVDLYISGHTHIPIMEHIGEAILFNPGSISLPKGKEKSSYGMIQQNLLELRDCKTHKILKTLKL